jgi:hypothetical protein
MIDRYPSVVLEDHEYVGSALDELAQVMSEIAIVEVNKEEAA